MSAVIIEARAREVVDKYLAANIERIKIDLRDALFRDLKKQGFDVLDSADIKRFAGSNIILNAEVTRTIAEVVKRHGVTYEEIKSEARDHKTANARQELMYWLMERHGLTSIRAGKLLNRDHSTVLYAVKKYRDIIEDREFARRQRRMAEAS